MLGTVSAKPKMGNGVTWRWRRWRWWWVVAFWLLTGPMEGSAEQSFANQPSPQTAVIGSTVVLPCRVINKVGELQWTRDDFGLGNERELYAFKRYQMIGSDEEGDFSLRISPVTLEDEAYFQCQVTGWKGVPGVRSQTAKLTVYVPPEAPTITQGPLVTTTSGAKVQLECISKGGKPAAEIQWLDGSARVVSEGVRYAEELMKDGHRSNAKSTLGFVANRQHHNSVFTCTASNPALHHAFSKQVRLEVKYAPEVMIKHDQDGYREGETAILTCSANANPNVLTYRWYRAGQIITGSNSTKLVVPDVTRDSNTEDITCEVSNDIGTSKKITRLSIHYGPSFKIQPGDQYADIGDNVTLRCQVDSSPDPTIVWINQQSQTVVGKGPVIHIIVDKHTAGTYLCIAKVEGFPEISAFLGIFLKGPPKARCEKEQSGKQGDKVRLECLITAASARSMNVLWTHRGEHLDLEEKRFEVTQEITSRGIRHTLFIHDATATDFGAYNFSVHNEYGSDGVEVFLKETKTLPVLMLVCGVLGGAALVFLVIMIIMCGKRSAKRHKDSKSQALVEKSVALQMNDQNSSCDSDLKVDMDQRTGSSMSNKETVLDCWEKEIDRDSTHNYMASRNSYIFPDTFSAVPVKMNGYMTANGGLQYDSFSEHGLTMSQQQPLSKKLSPSGSLPTPNTGPLGNCISSAAEGAGGGGRVGGGGGGGLTGSPHAHPQSIVTQNQHRFYPNYSDFDATGTHESTPDGGHGFSPGFPGGLTNQSYKAFSGSIPLSLHVNTRSNGIAGGNATSTLPRLGLPADPSQYIVPPRNKVIQGALATHV
ncbi:LOW QUALITY PROTEIN: irregular chiasm C-roughest protein-like [Macrobrachium rosenbergii]|uniref:LOW QUALITY PROTEIN: irregular chiasm C-roughest protein-like n=1 Tax=Macrobrachium rosenbergii TaxID=79674 RepID=UPI0034D4D947